MSVGEALEVVEHGLDEWPVGKVEGYQTPMEPRLTPETRPEGPTRPVWRALTAEHHPLPVLTHRDDLVVGAHAIEQLAFDDRPHPPEPLGLPAPLELSVGAGGRAVREHGVPDVGDAVASEP